MCTASIVLAGGVTTDNIFYRLCPTPLLMPMIVLATAATVIASQSIITGAFSITRQAIQLGWFPRLKIIQTSAEGYGQIYVGPVNWLLMVVTIALTIGFGKSDNLAAAYGIAVSATMLMTSALLLIAMREIWRWSLLASIGVAGIFLAGAEGAGAAGADAAGQRHNAGHRRTSSTSPATVPPDRSNTPMRRITQPCCAGRLSLFGMSGNRLGVGLTRDASLVRTQPLPIECPSAFMTD